MWSVGCIFAELILKTPLFMGSNELDQLDKIFKVLGNPNDENWPEWKTSRYFQQVQTTLKKKNKQNKLRDKFPIISMSEDDPLFLSDEGLDLLQGLLTYDPNKRMTSKQALNHSWFKEEPFGTEMPFFQALNEISRDELKRNRKRSIDDKQI